MPDRGDAMGATPDSLTRRPLPAGGLRASRRANQHPPCHVHDRRARFPSRARRPSPSAAPRGSTRKEPEIVWEKPIFYNWLRGRLPRWADISGAALEGPL